jgi:hypothetical protein
MSERPTQEQIDLARAGLLEITDAKSVGDAFARVDEVDGVVSVLFHCTLDGYPGWHWTVSLGTVEGEAPTVLEAELQPGEGALLSPDWVPWTDRLADYQAQQEAESESDDDDFDDESGDDDDDDDDESDDDDDDESDDDDDDLGDAGDDVYDGVDVDELAPGAHHDDEEPESDEHAEAGGDEHVELDDDADSDEHDEDQQRH